MPVLEGARAAAARLMTETCTITRAGTGTQVYDPATDTFTEPARTTVYSGPCRVKAPTGGDRRVSAGDDVYTLDTYVVSIPVSSTAIRTDDQVSISAAADDPRLVGMALRVQAVTVGSQISARRLTCEVMK